MTLLFLVNTCVWGGAEAFLWLLCRDFCNRGVPVVVVCPPAGPVFSRFSELPTVACYREDMGTDSYRFRGLGSLALYALGSKVKLARLITRMRDLHACDTVVCQYPREQVLTAELANELGFRSVWMIHSRFHLFLLRAILQNRLKHAMPKASDVFVFSNSTRSALVEAGFFSNSMHVVPEAVDMPSSTPPRDRSKRRIGVVSRLNYSKGVQDVLAAAPHVLRDYPAIEFLVAGEGRYRESLEKQARRLGIKDAVHFLGFVSDPWRDVFSRIEILAHPTFDACESMPLAILEAGAAGIPVVTTHWNGIPEIVRDGITGVLVAPRNVLGLAGALKRLLGDPQQSSTMGSEARRWVRQNFTIGRVSDTVLERLSQPKEAQVVVTG